MAVADVLVVGALQVVALHLEGLELQLGGAQRLHVRGPGGLKGGGGLLGCLHVLYEGVPLLVELDRLGLQNLGGEVVGLVCGKHAMRGTNKMGKRTRLRHPLIDGEG